MISFQNYQLQREGLTKQMQAFTAPLLSELNLNEESTLVSNMRLAIWEMLCNVIEHSKDNSDNRIDLVLEWSDHQIMITIIDHGKGFNWHGCMPCEPPDITQLGGRGLLMTRELCDEFSFDESGKKATLIFHYTRPN